MKLKFVLIIIIVITSVGGIVWYYYPLNTSNEKIIIKCRYMAYACGDCYSQYRIDSVYGKSLLAEGMVGKDITVKFPSNDLESSIDKETAKCAICYDFYFSGELRQSKGSGIVFYAEQVRYKLRDNKCCN